MRILFQRNRFIYFHLCTTSSLDQEAKHLAEFLLLPLLCMCVCINSILLPTRKEVLFSRRLPQVLKTCVVQKKEHFSPRRLLYCDVMAAKSEPHLRAREPFQYQRRPMFNHHQPKGREMGLFLFRLRRRMNHKPTTIMCVSVSHSNCFGFGSVS